MAKEMELSEIKELMNGPLVNWFTSCLKERTSDKLAYEELVDGVLIHNVFIQIDLHAQDEEVSASFNDPGLRLRNLTAILNNLRHFYEEEQGHLILRLPDISRLAKEPANNVRELELILCLLLGCAVQCPNNEHFIAMIRSLDDSTQEEIAKCIEQVIYVPEIVLTPEMLTRTEDAEKKEDEESTHQEHMQKVFEQIRQIYQERNVYRDKLLCIVRNGNLTAGHKDISVLVDEDELNNIQDILNCSTRSDYEDVQKREAELIECRTKVRTQRQEIKEVTDDLHECREELQLYKLQMAKLQKENERLVSEARSAKSYRDLLDAVNEKAEKADRLEQEITRYKEKLEDVDFYKSRLDQLRQDNQLLMENKEMLFEQIGTYKFKADKVLDLETKIFELKKQVDSLTLENEVGREKYAELCEENAQLEGLLKTSTSEALENGFEKFDTSDESSRGSMNNSLSEQLTNSAQSQALKLELENRRLSTLVDSLKTNALQENSSKFLVLEKDNKQLSLTVGLLKKDLKKCIKKYKELERYYKKALKQNERIQHREDQKSKCGELEKRYEIAVREKKRLHSLLETVQKRSVELERNLDEANRKLEARKVMKDAVNESMSKQKEFESRIADLEEEKKSALKELAKEQKISNERLEALDTTKRMMEELEKKLQMVEKQADDSNLEVERLKNLVEMVNKKFYNTLKMKRSPINISKNKSNEENDSNVTRSENKEDVKLQALIETFESQSQLTALKITNNQLAAEKEILQKARDKLSSDQEHLKALHDQLNSDYQKVLQNRNVLRNNLRDAKLKIRRQSESIEELETTCKILEDECKTMKSNSIKQEYAELKEDFDKLYKVNEAISSECHRTKSELNKLQVKQSKHQEEINAKNIKIFDFELEFTKLSHRCDILTQMNEGLEKDKRSFMEHISQLLKQNHQLVAQSLEDREYYHMEERKNIDMVINLNTQKVKLEEKIMDHYRKMESCPAKKKTSSIVKSTFVKVRRAGSGLFNRSRRSWAEEPASERSYEFEFTRGHDGDTSLDSARQPRISDFTGLANPRSRKSVDFLDSSCQSRDSYNQPRTRKSMDFLDFNYLSIKDDHVDLDTTLRDMSNDNNLEDDEADIALFSLNKTIDLSFKEDEKIEDDKLSENNNEKVTENNNIVFHDQKEEFKIEKSEPYNVVWLEHGCA